LCAKLLHFPMVDVSVGPLGSRAAKAIGFIEKMIEYSYVNAPFQKELLAGEIIFLCVHHLLLFNLKVVQIFLQEKKSNRNAVC
jgi:hypothetical protein